MLLLKTYVKLIKGGFPGKADSSHVFLLFSKVSGGATVVDIYARQFGFERTPFVATGTLDEIAAIVKLAPTSKLNPKMEMEGIVIRPFRELKKEKNERIIYKLKVADLLGRNARKL